MKDHRVRLDDREVLLVLNALRARYAGLKTDARREETWRLYERLLEGLPGNPNWRLGEDRGVRKDTPRG